MPFMMEPSNSKYLYIAEDQASYPEVYLHDFWTAQSKLVRILTSPIGHQLFLLDLKAIESKRYCSGIYYDRSKTQPRCPLSLEKPEIPYFLPETGLVYERDYIKIAIESTLMHGEPLNLDSVTILPDKFSSITIHPYGESWPKEEPISYRVYDIVWPIYTGTVTEVPGLASQLESAGYDDQICDWLIKNAHQYYKRKTGSEDEEYIFRNILIADVTLIKNNHVKTAVTFRNVKFQNVALQLDSCCCGLRFIGCLFLNCNLTGKAERMVFNSCIFQNGQIDPRLKERMRNCQA